MYVSIGEVVEFRDAGGRLCGSYHQHDPYKSFFRGLHTPKGHDVADWHDRIARAVGRVVHRATIAPCEFVDFGGHCDVSTILHGVVHKRILQLRSDQADRTAYLPSARGVRRPLIFAIFQRLGRG